MLWRPSRQKLSRESPKLSSPLILLEKGESLRGRVQGSPLLSCPCTYYVLTEPALEPRPGYGAVSRRLP